MRSSDQSATVGQSSVCGRSINQIRLINQLKAVDQSTENEKSINKNYMDNNTKQQGSPFQLDLPQDIAQGEYANFAIITHSSSDFILDFARVLPGVQQPSVKSRVILAPEHAKRLLLALQENVLRYEKEFGAIKIPNQQPRTATPFNINQKGEA